MVKLEILEFKVSTDLLPWFINGDRDGLTDLEEEALHSFTQHTTAMLNERGCHFNHWSCDEANTDDFGFCEVTSFFCARSTLKAVGSREINEEEGEE